MNYEELKRQLEREEGRRYIPYQDIDGNWTIGVGHNLAVPLSDTIVNAILDEDISRVIAELDQYLPWWQKLDDVRQQVLVDLGFNMGINRLLKFKKTLQFIKMEEFDSAANELLNSKAARKLSKRYKVLAEMLRTGIG